MSLTAPMTPGNGVDHGAPGRVWIDEPDQFHAQLAAPIEELPGQADGGAAAADDEQPLGRLAAQRQPVERDAPADEQRDDEQGGERDDAAAEHQPGNPVVGDGEHRRRRAERAQRADEQFAAVGGRPQVVEIAVVKADLHDTGHDHGAQHPADGLLRR